MTIGRVLSVVSVPLYREIPDSSLSFTYSCFLDPNRHLG